MENLKVYYAKLNNMGDLLSEYLIPQITGRGVTHCEKVSEFQIMGVGSCGGAVWGRKESGLKENLKDFIKKGSCRSVNNPCAVWGTGFLKDYYPQNLKLIRNNVSFIAVRGALSKRIIENSLGEKINPVMCDGGILAAELLDEVPKKKYQIGLIPHYNEQQLIMESGIQNAFEKKYKNSLIINLRNDPLEVIKQIGQCEYIISSSLHGCVVADSFGIPNIRVMFSTIPGTGFKFDDYYSGYGLEIPAVIVDNPELLPTMKVIEDQYQIAPSKVEQKKRDMADCLQKFVENIE